MKRLIHKIRNKRQKTPLPSRITTETVAQHREHILAGGRRFKYPVQYLRHKLVFNAIAISLVALIIVMIIGWWQLYRAQNTSEFMYRVTKVIPVPVASVDGQSVSYADYLMKYRSSIHYLETKEQASLNTEDGTRQIEYIKQQSLQDAIADAYALKLSKKLGLSVSDRELALFIKNQRQTSDGEISEQVYNSVTFDYYGWTPSEYRYVTRVKLLSQKVSYALDKNALGAINAADAVLKKDSGTDLKTLTETISSQNKVQATHGTSGWVPKDNEDGGLALTASKLQRNQLSSVVKSTIGDGYYVVKLLDINTTQVNYEYIHVPLSAFKDALSNVTKKGGVKKYISV
jgi:hypothetical protein